MTTARTKRLTFAEWQALPETRQKCEVVDGVLVMPPSPFGEHAWQVRVMFGSLDTFLTRSGLGIVLTAPHDVVVQGDPLRVRQPDLLVVDPDVSGISVPADLAGLRFLDTPPLLIVEVLSPSNTPSDIEARLADYRNIGVLECWMAHFATRKIRILRLTPDAAESLAVYGMGDTLRSEVLPGFEMAIEDVFGPLLAQRQELP